MRMNLQALWPWADFLVHLADGEARDIGLLP